MAMQNNRKWLTLIAMTGSLSMIMLDQTIVAVSLPTIQRDLNMSTNSLQWLINAYVLAIAATVAIGGRIGDMFGRVKTFVLGVIVFGTSSLVCGFAPNTEMILISRCIQGIGAAFMQPASAALTIESFEFNERGKAMAIYAGVGMAFMAVGPLLGGFFTEYITWRWSFWINPPIAIIILLLVFFIKPEGNVLSKNKHFDFLGITLLIFGLPFLILGIQQGNEWLWSSFQVISLITGGLMLLLIFLFVESKNKNPLINIKIFKIKSFTGDCIILFCIQFALIGQAVFGPIYIQKVLDYSPLATGFFMLVLVLPVMVVSQFAGHIYDKIGSKTPILIGTSLIILGFFWQGQVLIYKSIGLILPPMFILGVGIGFVMAPANTDALNRVHKSLTGQASGILQTLRQMGGTVGMAMIGVTFATSKKFHIENISEKYSSLITNNEQLKNIFTQIQEGFTPDIALLTSKWPEILTDLKTSLAESIAYGYYLGAIVVFLGFLASIIFMPKGRQVIEK